MTLDLDAITEQRIQREIDLGRFSTPAEVIVHALDLLTSEDDWLPVDKDTMRQRLELSYDQAQRGETYSPEQARAILARSRLAASE